MIICRSFVFILRKEQIRIALGRSPDSFLHFRPSRITVAMKMKCINETYSCGDSSRFKRDSLLSLETTIGSSIRHLELLQR